MEHSVCTCVYENISETNRSWLALFLDGDGDGDSDSDVHGTKYVCVRAQEVWRLNNAMRRRLQRRRQQKNNNKNDHKYVRNMGIRLRNSHATLTLANNDINVDRSLLYACMRVCVCACVAWPKTNSSASVRACTWSKKNETKCTLTLSLVSSGNSDASLAISW